jgi:hypothetical protein
MGVIAAQSVVRASPVNAAPSYVVLDASNNGGSNSTGIDSTDPNTVFYGENGGSGSGLTGFAGSGSGVVGQSTSGVGVTGYGTSAEGVYGQAGSTTGTTPNPSGVHGVTDVAGYQGVYGEHMAGGVGVEGISRNGNGYGVLGIGFGGVFGLPTSGGTGVTASAPSDGTGLALAANGPATFSLSGTASIAAGAKSATVTGVSLRAGSLVLATVQSNAGVWVSYATPNVSGSKITIHLNAAVPAGKTADVAWFVVN